MVISLFGVMRLHFETDILEVLPQEMKPVQALKQFTKHFSEERQVVVLLQVVGEDEDAQVTKDDAESLAEFLRSQWSDSEVLYESKFEEHPKLLASSLALMWSYSSPKEIDVVSERFRSAEKLDSHLAEIKWDLQNGLNQEEAMINAYDPIGFLQHPAIKQLKESELSFSSDDGRYRLLMIRKKHESDTGYKSDEVWVREVRNKIDRWIKTTQTDDGRKFSYQLTGGPVFNAEIGSGMENDMRGTIVITSLLIAGLFILMQRSLGQLFMVSGLLAMTFFVTLGVAGWLLGSLNLVSVGFAAILLGLVVDYAIVILRESSIEAESLTDVTRKRKSGIKWLRRLVTPSILMAALSTALVFGVLAMSTFTGVKQLGYLVVLGLLVGSVVMLIMMPWVVSFFTPRAPKVFLTPIFFSPKYSWRVLIGSVFIFLMVFVFRGFPQVSFDLKMAEPKSSQAAQAFDVMQREFSAWSDKNTILMVSGHSLKELKERAVEANRELQSLKKQGEIVSYLLPVDLIPDLEAYRTNQKEWEQILKKQKSVFKRSSRLVLAQREWLSIKPF